MRNSAHESLKAIGHPWGDLPEAEFRCKRCGGVKGDPDFVRLACSNCVEPCRASLGEPIHGTGPRCGRCGQHVHPLVVDEQGVLRIPLHGKYDPKLPESGLHDLTCKWVCPVIKELNEGTRPWDQPCDLEHSCSRCSNGSTSPQERSDEDAARRGLHAD